LEEKRITAELLHQSTPEAVEKTEGYLKGSYSDEMDAITQQDWKLHFVERPNGEYHLQISLKEYNRYETVKGMVVKVNNTRGVVIVRSFLPLVIL